ncbi:hypothetical protein Ms3S1_15650 [Methylosinus sp. 3S-1]
MLQSEVRGRRLRDHLRAGAVAFAADGEDVGRQIENADQFEGRSRRRRIAQKFAHDDRNDLQRLAEIVVEIGVRRCEGVAEEGHPAPEVS